jgi:hypothetical protein
VRRRADGRARGASAAAAFAVLIPRIVVVLVLSRCEQRAVLRAVRREAHVGRVQRHECRAPRDMTPIVQRDVLAADTMTVTRH